jgi:glycerol kinase
MATSTPTTNSQLEDPKLQKEQPVSQHVENVPGSCGAKHEAHLPKGVSETEEEKEKHWFIGSIDQGTTSSRFLIFNGEGSPVASHQIEFENMYPEPGSVLEFLFTTSIALLIVSF